MKVKVDPDLCISCELCVNLCPEVFRMEDGKAMAFVADVPSAAEETCRQAEDQCPVDAITLSS
jgi:ferredoxin